MIYMYVDHAQHLPRLKVQYSKIDQAIPQLLYGLFYDNDTLVVFRSRSTLVFFAF
jgi:hypothetical protein